jgi:hypothetical protein
MIMDKTIHKEKIELLSRLMKDGAISKTEALLLLKNDEGYYTDFISDLKKDTYSGFEYINTTDGNYILSPDLYNITNSNKPINWDITSSSTVNYVDNTINLTTNANI